MKNKYKMKLDERIFLGFVCVFLAACVVFLFYIVISLLQALVMNFGALGVLFIAFTLLLAFIIYCYLSPAFEE